MLKLWRKISDIGINGTETEEEKKYINLINQIILFATVFTPAFIPLLLFCGDLYYIKYQSAFSFLFPMCFLLTGIRRFTLAIVIAQALVETNLVLASTLNENIGSEYLLFPVALISFIVFRRTLSCLVGFSVSVACFFLIQILKSIIVPEVVLEEDKRVILFQSIVLMSFLICAVIIFNFRAVIANYERSIVEQKTIIEDKNKEIIDSIRYAKRIQKALMPAERYIEKILNKFKDPKD